MRGGAVEHAVRLPGVKKKRKRPLGPDTKWYLFSTFVDVLVVVINLSSVIHGHNPPFVQFLLLWNAAAFGFFAKRNYQEFKKRYERDMND
jgi:hypothetical protein